MVSARTPPPPRSPEQRAGIRYLTAARRFSSASIASSSVCICFRGFFVRPPDRDAVTTAVLASFGRQPNVVVPFPRRVGQVRPGDDQRSRRRCQIARAATGSRVVIGRGGDHDRARMIRHHLEAQSRLGDDTEFMEIQAHSSAAPPASSAQTGLAQPTQQTT
jgi:hypothetical protein